jgi:hypothetical protein
MTTGIRMQRPTGRHSRGGSLSCATVASIGWSSIALIGSRAAFSHAPISSVSFGVCYASAGKPQGLGRDTIDQIAKTLEAAGLPASLAALRLADDRSLDGAIDLMRAVKEFYGQRRG